MTDLAIDAEMFWRDLPKIAASMDDPAADYVMVPTYFLAEAVHAAGLKVVLTGEGGDELFAGYGRYRSAMRPWWRGGRTMRARGVFDGLGVLREAPTGWRDGIAAAEQTADTGTFSRLQSAQAADCADWLPNDLLIKVDRCLMSHGVEGRTPFLDPEVAAVAFRLPDHLKVHDGRGKWLLRKMARRGPARSAAVRTQAGLQCPGCRVDGSQCARDRPVGRAPTGYSRSPCDPRAVESLFAKKGKTPRLCGLGLAVLRVVARPSHPRHS